MQRPSSQWEVLSATRFVLAMIVLVAHLDVAAHIPAWWTRAGTFLDGLSAVYGFLLISGYSIAASIERSEPGYLWRRVKRIYPTYLASLGLTALGMAGGLITPEPASRFLVTALMLHTFIGPTVAADGQLWTLAVEWWNYMLAPIYRRVRDLALIALVLMSLALFLLMNIKSGAIGAATAGGKMFALLSWFWLTGFLYYRHRRTIYGYALLFAPLEFAASFGWIGRAAWIGAIALAVCEPLSVPSRLRRVCQWLGDLSYPIYAMHIPIFAICLSLGIRSPGLVALASLLLSIVILHAIDLPARRARAPSLLTSMAKRSPAAAKL